MTTQTENNRANDESQEVWLSRKDPIVCLQEQRMHNAEPPIKTATTQLEAGHHMITEGLLTTLERATATTEEEKDMPLFRRRLQRALGVRFIAAAPRKDGNLRPLINFVKKRD